MKEFKKSVSCGRTAKCSVIRHLTRFEVLMEKG